MDDARVLRVSRYIDGDLSDRDRRDFEREMLNDPELRVAVDDARQLQQAVASVAGDMAPPSSLDAVMEPLRRSGPVPPRRVRPAFRWLGAAAAVVLAVTIASEMAHRLPGPTDEIAHGGRVLNHDEEPIFQLAPLPSAVPGEERPLGATDRLASETPKSPSAPEPEPLEIMGPLPEAVTTGEDAAAAPGSPSNDAAAAFGSTVEQEADREPSKMTRRSDAGIRHEPAPALRAAETTVAPADGAPLQVRLVVGGETVWTGRSTCLEMVPRRVRIRVNRNVVVAVVDHGSDRSSAACLRAAVVGTEVVGLADGNHEALIVPGNDEGTRETPASPTPLP